MSGNWNFYNSSGRLTTKINCKNEGDFTPLLIIDKNGDTTLKDGNGKFILDMQNQLPIFFYGKKSYVIEGEAKDGLKEGSYSCYFTLPKKQLFFSVTYKKGKFQSTETSNDFLRNGLMNIADYQYSLAPSNLEKIDHFNHTNFVFEYNYDAEDELINFLINNKTPLIESRTKNTKENDDLFFDLIENVLYDTLMDVNKPKDIYYKRFKYPVKTYYSAAYSKNERNAFPKINANITLTIDTAGYVVNSAFNSNLTKQQIRKINYYFSRISNLAQNTDNQEKSLYNVNLKLDMLVDTLQNDSFHVSYLIYDADSTLETDLTKYIDTSHLSAEDYYKEFTSVQTEAKFPGDWNKFLERNLNAQTPADHDAPPGRYSVTVSFLVDTTGNISEIKAENDPGFGTAQEAIRVIKKGPNWQPAIQNGKRVFYRQKQTIVFEVSRS